MTTLIFSFSFILRPLLLQSHQHTWNQNAKKHKLCTWKRWRSSRRTRRSSTGSLSRMKRRWLLRCRVICLRCWALSRVVGSLGNHRVSRHLRSQIPGRRPGRCEHNLISFIYCSILIITSLHILSMCERASRHILRPWGIIGGCHTFGSFNTGATRQRRTESEVR